MARQADIQYVRYPVDGTAARKAEHTSRHNTAAPVYSRRPSGSKVIAVDPVAVCAIVLSVVMLIAMAVGLVEYRRSLRQAHQMSQYVQQLQQENLQLQRTYKDGYDLEEIEKIVLEAGMVPAENMERVRIQMEQEPQEETRMSFWDTLTTFLTGFFA